MVCQHNSFSDNEKENKSFLEPHFIFLSGTI